MTLPARSRPAGPPRLTIVRAARTRMVGDVVSDWRRVAAAVLACTQELTRHMLEQRWGRVQEALSERRELLAWFGRVVLDTEGRRCLIALTQAADESEAAIVAMMGARRAHS
jgi:hypothetical protein